MADARRTLTDIQTNLFQDGQADGQITEQNQRDFVETVGRLPYGSIYTLTPVETTIVSSGVYVKGACTTQSNLLRDFTMPANNRLQYVGLIPIIVEVSCTMTVVMAGNNNLSSFKLYFYDDSAASGAVIDGSVVDRFVGTGVDAGAVALGWDLEMHENDYLELWMANMTDTDNMTLNQLRMRAKGEAL